MFVPRKPNPFGNEWHTINCAKSRILFGAELMEGKDEPKELKAQKEKGTSGLLLRLTKAMHNTGKIVVLDSVFCVLKALLDLKKVGFYAAAVIKKWRYWPKHVPGDEIDEKMKDCEIGENKVMTGKLDGEKYNFFMMKELEYIMKMMSIYGDRETADKQETTRRYFINNDRKMERREFNYTTVFANHFRYRHAIDDTNNQRHNTPSFEETWKTIWWANRVFSFLIALTEVNAYNTFRFWNWSTPAYAKKEPTLLQFFRRLALDLIYNDFLEEETKDTSSKLRKRKRDHNLFTAPPHGKKFCAGKWDKTSKQKYQQFTCKQEGCKRKVRTYCSCAPAEWMCQLCFAAHIVDVATSEESGY